MKKILSVLLALLVLFMTAGCAGSGVPESGGEPEYPSVDAAGEEVPEYPSVDAAGEEVPEVPDDILHQLELIAKNQNLWFLKDARLEGSMWYALMDLDENGRLEIFRTHELGSMYGAPIDAWQVSESGTELVHLEYCIDGSVMARPSLHTSYLPGYSEAGTNFYTVQSRSGGPDGSMALDTMICIRGNQIFEYCFAGSNTRLLDSGAVITDYMDANMGILPYEEYEKRVNTPYYSDFFVEAYPGWYNLRSGDDVEVFLTWSWNYWQQPWDYGLRFPISAGPDLMVYFDEPGSEYGSLAEEKDIIPLMAGYEDGMERFIRFVCGTPGLTLTLERVIPIRTAAWETEYYPAFEVFSFTPAVGTVYELPVSLPEGEPEYRLKLSSGAYSDTLNLCIPMEDGMPIRYQQVEMNCLEPQRMRPDDGSAILEMARCFAGWTVLMGSPELVQENYWDVLANAVSLNSSSIDTGWNDWYKDVPFWLVEEYAKAMFQGTNWGPWDIPDLQKNGAVRELEDAPGICRVISNLANSARDVQICRICAPEEMGYEEYLGTVAVEFTVYGQQEDTVIVFLEQTDYNMFGWYICNAFLAMG